MPNVLRNNQSKQEVEMSIIEWKKDESVAIMTMNNGENRHNPDFIKAILMAFDEIENDETISSVIITSSDKKTGLWE